MKPTIARRSSIVRLARLTVRLAVAVLAVTSSPSMAAIFEVNTTGNQPDTNPGNGLCEISLGPGLCTLRAALEEANALPNELNGPGGSELPDRIEFDIAPPGVHTIEVLGSGLPEITAPSFVGIEREGESVYPLGSVCTAWAT